MAELVTPSRAPPEATTALTRPRDPESAHQTNLRTSKRQQRDLNNQAPLRFALGEGATNNPPATTATASGDAGSAVTSALTPHLNAARQAFETHEQILSSVAQAIDTCMAAYKAPHEVPIAHKIRQLVIRALQNTANPAVDVSAASSRSNSSDRSNTTNSTSAGSRTYADAASSLRDSGTDTDQSRDSGRARKGKTARTRPTEKEDARILISVPPAARLARPSPYAIRQAIVKAVEGITLHDIPKATATKTGWAITPANHTTRDRLMEQENKEKTRRALDATDIFLPERWINYAVQNVGSSYRSLTGHDVLTTVDMVWDEASTQTGATPASCRASRHGPDQHGSTTWIISFLRPVRPFQLFGTSDRSKEIHKKTAIQRHDTGCQGYCNPSTCARAPRCSNCGEKATSHEGPRGEACPHKTKCANCYGPHRSGQRDCPAAPRREGDRIIRPTKRELAAIRRLGQRSFQQTHAIARTYAQTMQTEASDASQSSDTGGAPLPPHPGAPRTRTTPEDQPTPPEASPRTATTAAPTAAAPARGRPHRTARNTGRQSLNLAELSARSLEPSQARNPNHTGTSSSEVEDISMSDNVESC